MGTSYDGLYDGAVKLYDKAVEEYLSETYSIYKRDGKFYSPRESDPYYGSDSDTYCETDLEEKVAEAVGKFDDVPSLFDKFASMPDPGDFDSYITDVASGMRSLSVAKSGVSDPISGEQYPYNTELKNMSTSAGYLDEWDGVAMMQFRDDFIAKFEERVLNQFNAAAVIKNALMAEQELWKRARENVCKIVDDGYAALDHMHDCGKNEWTIALSIVGAVVVIGSAVATAGGTAALALTAVGAAGSIASSVAGTMGDPVDRPFSGESAEAVIKSVREGVKEFEERLKESEDKIKTACETANGTLEVAKEDYQAPKPRLLDGGTVGKPDSD
jgi:hypothetical protein